MKILRLMLRQAFVAVWLTALLSFPAPAAPHLQQSPANSFVFFDVSDLPARVDEPSLSKRDKEFILDCGVANRSGEQLMGIRFTLLVIDSTGKLRQRINWTERVGLAMYSIKTLGLHPEMSDDIRKSDQLFLGIEEVFGRDTIWRAEGAEKALSAYARGHHDVVPTVRTLANKYDRPDARAVPLEKKQ